MATAKKGKAKQGKAKGNRYEKKANQSDILNSITTRSVTKGDPKNTAIETVKDLAVGVIVGGLAGAVIGKPAFIVGLGITGAGHYTGNPLAATFGLGLMAANGFQNKSVSGIDGLSIDAIKERVTAYTQELKGKLYLDKVSFLNKNKEESASGVDGLQFFEYPSEMSGAYNELNNELAALDDIERQIENSGLERMQMHGIGIGDVEGYDDEVGRVGELGEMGDLSDISDRNL